MMPEGADKKIRSVNIYYDWRIASFKFFDKDKLPIWEIGWTCDFKTSSRESRTVMLAENEFIIGVVAKPHQTWQSSYTDF